MASPRASHPILIMRLAKGATEDGIVIGNTTDKYQSSNPLVSRMMAAFTRSLEGFVNEVRPATIHEVGCGEGYWSIYFARREHNIRGSDFSSTVACLARENATAAGLDVDFKVRSIYDLKVAED